MEKRYVFLDPDGTWSRGWLAVVVQAPTGITYASQCGGVANECRRVEGYLVPLGGLKYDPDLGRLDSAELRAVFHDNSRCVGRATAERISELARLVAEIPFWVCREDTVEERGRLKLDDIRMDQVMEAWVPVQTPEGAGILLWDNCD